MRLSHLYLATALALLGFARGGAAAPPLPVFPNPANGATNVTVDTQLFWSPGEQELIVNGDFELGNFNGWTKVNQGGDTFINNGTYLPNNGAGALPPYAGSFCSTTDLTGGGGFFTLFQTIYQDVTIPANANYAVLRWVDRMRNFAGQFFNPPRAQRFIVEVRTLSDAPLEILYLTENGDNPFSDWTKRSADLRRYAGQRVRIAFTCELSRNFYQVLLDNISLVTRALPATYYDVYFGTNSTLVASNLVGTVSNGAWRLPALRPNTTYYWRINTRQGNETAVGPVWQFRTHPVTFPSEFVWAPIASPQATGQPIAVELFARDAGHSLSTNALAFPAPFPLQAFRLEDASYPVLESEPHSAFANHERSTVGYAFTPAMDLMVTAVRSYSGEKVSIWKSSGVPVASVAVNGAAGAWTQTPLTRPVGLAAGQTYVLGVYSAGLATNYLRFEGIGDFAHGTIDQAYEGSGDAMPTAAHPARWWFVDLVYSPAVGDPLDVTPNSISSLPNGVWRGPVTFHESASRVYLRAGDTFLSGMFAVSDAPLRITSVAYDGDIASITFMSVQGQSYILQRSSTGLPGSWEPVKPAIPGTGLSMQIDDSTANTSPRLYRLFAQ